jgi:hypothetical protein
MEVCCADIPDHRTQHGSNLKIQTRSPPKILVVDCQYWTGLGWVDSCACFVRMLFLILVPIPGFKDLLLPTCRIHPYSTKQDNNLHHHNHCRFSSAFSVAYCRRIFVSSILNTKTKELPPCAVQYLGLQQLWPD